MSNMEHPTYEELLAHLEGTSPVDSAKQVKQHLENCPECAAELAGWQRTIKKLEQQEWPNAQEVPVGFAGAGTMLKWAAAAAVLMLGIGFGLGRLSEPSALRFKPAVAAQVKQQVQSELKAQLLAAFTPGGTDSFGLQLRRELISSLSASQTSTEKEQLAQQILQAVQQKQDENQRMLLALLYQVRQEHEADYLALRHDLETAASVADSDLQQNRQQLSQLAATLIAKNQQ
jgi:anti-sigma factor RsiW